MFKQVGVVAEIWQKTEDELIELHHGKCTDQFAEQADEIERLRKLAHNLYEETKRCGSLHDTPATMDYEEWLEEND